MDGNLASWEESDIWNPVGSISKITMDLNDICSKGGSENGMLVLMPTKLNWPQSVDFCRQFGGRLHIDDTAESVEKSYTLVEKGESLYADRCARVWLGASDIQEEGIWRDSESNEILNITDFWNDGQPNGVRIQNCAGIWELVSFLGFFKFCV